MEDITLFSCLHGSQLYGTSHADSDIDIKKIVLPNLPDILLGKFNKNKVKAKTTIEVDGKITKVDEEHISIQTFAKDFLKGQTYALELAFAVKFTNAEQKIFDPLFATFCEELRDDFLTSSIAPLMAFAESQAAIYSQKGRRLKGRRLNSALAMKELLKKFPKQNKLSQDWDKLYDLVLALSKEYPDCIRLDKCYLDNKDTANCIVLLARTLPAAASFQTVLSTVESIIKKYGYRANAAKGDEVDWKATAHALRVIDEGIAILNTGELVFPYEASYCDKIKSVIRGEVDYTVVAKEIEEKMGLLATTQISSSLQKRTPELYVKFEEWLSWFLRRFYGKYYTNYFKDSFVSRFVDSPESVELTGNYNFL